MAISVEGWTAAQGQRQRSQPAGLQGSWLFELEQAMLAQASKKPAPQQRQEQPEVAGAEGGERAPAASKDAGDAAQGQTGAASSVSAGRQVRPDAADAAARTAAPAHAATTTATAGAEVVDARARAPVAGAGAAAMAPAAWGGVTASPGALAAGIAAAYAQAGPAAAARMADSGGEAGAAAQPVAARAAAPGAATLALSAQAGEPELPPAADGVPDEPAAGGELQAAEREEFARRLLHVYRDAEGVQAWVRDAGIGQAQARQLAQAMASELADAGTPLSALTLNGKRLSLPAAAAPAPGPQDAYDNGDLDADPAPLAAPRNINPNGAA